MLQLRPFDDIAKSPMLSVLMPVFNEEATLETIIHRTLQAPVQMPIELICVDDGSSDRSPTILEQLRHRDSRIRVFTHSVNRGKGAAVRTAIQHMTGDIALIQDADLEYDPTDYPALVTPIVQGRAGAVFGSRYAQGRPRRVSPFWHTMGNRVFSLATNLLYNVNLTDAQTCYKVVRSDILRTINLTGNTFTFDPELTAWLCQMRVPIYEVPIDYDGRSAIEGKKLGPRGVMQAFWALAKFRIVTALKMRGESSLESVARVSAGGIHSVASTRPAWAPQEAQDCD